MQQFLLIKFPCFVPTFFYLVKLYTLFYKGSITYRFYPQEMSIVRLGGGGGGGGGVCVWGGGEGGGCNVSL